MERERKVPSYVGLPSIPGCLLENAETVQRHEIWAEPS